jgi:hypothetical protein
VPRHIHLYAGVWAGYFAMLALLPVRYGTLEKFSASTGMALWVGLSLLVAYAVHSRYHSRRPLTTGALLPAGTPLTAGDLERLIWLSLAMSVLGFLSLCFDRIVVQGIDFSNGIAAARHLWRQSGEGRESVSSIFSVLGYLLGFTFFVATTLAHLHWERLRRRTRLGVVIVAFLLIAANSLLTGGRSIVLVQLACIVSVCGIRAVLGMTMMPGRGARIWLGGSVAMILCIGYSLYVFSARAELGQTLPERYATSMLGYLGATPTPGFYELNVLPSSVAATAQFSTVAGAYLTHSYGTFESVLEMDTTPGNVSFGFIRDMLAKLGVAQPATEQWTFSGRFLSVPGSLWYDFGWFGFFAGAAVLGILIGSVPRVLTMRRGAGVSLMAVLVILLTAFLAPLVLSIDILSVPFLILGFLQVDVIQRLFLGGGGNWLQVSHTVRRADVVPE